jgi:hypothetical protein
LAAAEADARAASRPSEIITRIPFSHPRFLSIPATAGAESNLCPKCNRSAAICRSTDSFD